MTHPIGYYASAPHGTRDAAILAVVEEQIGSFSQNLSHLDKLAVRAVLCVYLLYTDFGIENYKISDAILDTLPDSDASVCNVIELMEGISENAAEGLIAFLSTNLRTKCYR